MTIYEAPGISGWTSQAELQWLFDIAQTVDSIVEVGSWKGRSTHALCSGCPGTVYAVDHWRGSRDERSGPHREATERNIFADFRANVGHFANLVIVHGESPAISEACPDVDMVWIDGGHAYDEVLADLKAWLPKARKIVCGHDYSLPGVKRAVSEVFRQVEHPAGDIWLHERLL